MSGARNGGEARSSFLFEGGFLEHGAIPPLKGDTGGCPAAAQRSAAGLVLCRGFRFAAFCAPALGTSPWLRFRAQPVPLRRGIFLGARHHSPFEGGYRGMSRDFVAICSGVGCVLGFSFCGVLRARVGHIPLAALSRAACPPSKGDFLRHGAIPPLKGDTGGCPATSLRIVADLGLCLDFRLVGFCRECGGSHPPGPAFVPGLSSSKGDFWRGAIHPLMGYPRFRRDLRREIISDTLSLLSQNHLEL